MGERSKFKLTGSKVLAAILILAGLGVLGYYGGEKLLVVYHQYQLRKAFEDSFYDIPSSTDTYRRVVITEWSPMRLIIPKIDVDLMVLSGDVFDRNLLDKGPVHYGNYYENLYSPLPSTEPGNVAIAAHRGAKWMFFFRLDELEEGDQMIIEMAGYRFIYEVEWQKIIEPDDWSVIAPTDYPALTLTTCEPKTGVSTHRLIVRGKLVEVLNIADSDAVNTVTYG